MQLKFWCETSLHDLKSITSILHDLPKDDVKIEDCLLDLRLHCEVVSRECEALVGVCQAFLSDSDNTGIVLLLQAVCLYSRL